MKYLVTGGAGFIGSHLCKALLQQGHEVVCLDNLYTGCRSNINSYLSYSGFTFIEQDICLPLDVQVDGIFHLACPASPVHYQADAIKTVETCFTGTLNVLKLAEKLNAKVLFTSTSEVYGDPKCHPQSESYWGHVNCFGPRSCYDEGKRVAETLCYEFSKRRGVSIRIARLFNTYGPQMALNDGRIVSNFIIQALKNEPLTIYGDGKQTRSFCYVQDTIEGLMRLYESECSSPVNIGAPFEFTVLDLAQQVLKLTKSRASLSWHPLPGDDPTQRQPNIEKAHALLGWTPLVSLEQGLTKTIEYFSHALSETTTI